MKLLWIKTNKLQNRVLLKDYFYIFIYIALSQLSIIISSTLLGAYKNFGFASGLISIMLLTLTTVFFLRSEVNQKRYDVLDYLLLVTILASFILLIFKFIEIYNNSLFISIISRFIAFESCLILPIILRNRFTEFKHKINALKLITYSFIPIIVYGYIDFITYLSKNKLFGELLKLKRLNFSSLYAHYNLFSVIILILSIVVLYLATISKNKKERIFLFLYFGLLLFSMFLTFSRGGWVSLFISLLLFLILIIKRNRNSIILVLLCISLIATIVTITLFTTTKEIYEITDLGSEITSLDTLFVRIQSSIDSINHLLRNKCILLSGYGFYLSYSPMSKIISKTTGISYIHNTYIYAVAEMGLPFTLLLFITILVGAFKDVSNIHRKKYLEERKMNFALISIVIGFLIRISTEVIWPAFDRWTQIWFLFILIFSIMRDRKSVV